MSASHYSDSISGTKITDVSIVADLLGGLEHIKVLSEDALSNDYGIDII